MHISTCLLHTSCICAGARRFWWFLWNIPSFSTLFLEMMDPPCEGLLKALTVPILSQGSTPPHLSFRDILVVLFSTIFAGTAIFPALLYLLNETKMKIQFPQNLYIPKPETYIISFYSYFSAETVSLKRQFVWKKCWKIYKLTELRDVYFTLQSINHWFWLSALLR